MRKVRNVITNMFYIMRCDGSIIVVFYYLLTIFRYLKNYKKFNAVRVSFQKKIIGKYRNDWFSNNVPYWEFYVFPHLKGPSLNALEIGSWEGMSAFYMLSSLPNLDLVCIDSWDGSDEHSDLDTTLIEQRFDFNVKPFKNRVKKNKSLSLVYFSKAKLKGTYDLIYIDGSHYARDVLVDALYCFDLLNIGGFLIFDDYLWKFYAKPMNNPASAVNIFLKFYKNRYKLISVNYQIIIQRID
jgi:predicted O-methyltransferase YrrM